MAAISFALEISRVFTLRARNIQIFTSYSAWVGMSQKFFNEIDSKWLMRLMKRLGHYKHQVRYVPGRKNCFADAIPQNFGDSM